MSLPSDASEDVRRMVIVGRMWSIGGAVWAAAYLTIYIVLVTTRGGGIAWYYVGNVLLAIAMIGWSIVVPFGRTLLIVAAILLAVAVAVGLISIGILLGPAVIITAYAARRAFHPLSAGWQDR